MVRNELRTLVRGIFPDWDGAKFIGQQVAKRKSIPGSADPVAEQFFQTY